MDSLIEKIFLSPQGLAQQLNDSAEFCKLQKQYEEVCDKISAALPKDMQQTFNTMYRLAEDMIDEVQVRYFKQGLKYGVLVGIEVDAPLSK